MKVLITAGATWVKVDDVRILTNRFTGKTGLYLAKELKRKGHLVTLLINPHCVGGVIKGVEVISYRYFDEFKKAVDKILKANHYDVIIHTAAVSDYKVKNTAKGKISSRKKYISLELVPTEKIIARMRLLAKKSLLIQFKLEYRPGGLIEKAFKSLQENKSDFVVANALGDLDKGWQGFLINRDKNVIALKSKASLANALDGVIRSWRPRLRGGI